MVDLRKRFSLPEREQDQHTRIVVVELSDKVVGFIMDAVKEVIRVDRSVIEPPSDLVIGIDTHYIKGVAKLEDRLLILLELEEVLSADERKALRPSEDVATRAAA